MEILYITVQVILAVTSIMLTMTILLHRGRGGGLSDMFGGGVSSTLGSSGVAERNLNRLTVVIAIIWVLAVVAIGLFTRFELV
jgi:preprotein translocase subunit SecG